jgi:microsomal dipeptidase-like Zn-dependent dipeptidase
MMKSQFFPTVEQALLVQKTTQGLEVYGSITLNHPIGGLNPLAVDASGELGGKVVWMPTWSAKNELSKGGSYLNRLKSYLRFVQQTVPGPEAGIEILEKGKLKPVVKDIVQIAHHHRMVVSSGHISISESLQLVEECQRQGVYFVLTHPLSRSIGATHADLKEIAERGGFIEHCFIATMPLQHRLELSRIVEAIQEVGPAQTILSTDAVHTYHPPPPEVMRMFIGSLLHLKLDEASIRKMIHENPAKILELGEKGKEGIPQKF